MKRILHLTLAALMMFGFISCEAEATIIGKPGDVLIVMNEDGWNGELGKGVREKLTEAYMVLPQAEPHFKLKNISHEAFNNTFLHHRNIIIFEIDPSNHNNISYKESIWTPSQFVITIKANSNEKALKLFESKGDEIIQKIEEAERNRLISNYERYSAHEANSKVSNKFGGSPSFPSGAKVIKESDDFIWVSISNTAKIRKDVIIYKYPITDLNEAKSDDQSILYHNMAMMNKYVPGAEDNTYMTHSKFYPPYVTHIRHKKRDVAEIRGLWEVENDYMGGPFIGHEFVSKDRKYMIGVTGFVYAPRYEKIQHMRELEAIVYSFRFIGEDK